LAECKRLKVEVLPPSVNYSVSDFSIENKTQIRFGLAAIKNVGSAAISAILEAREVGPFVSLFDFASRVELTKVNKKTFESLIKAGAMDEFGKRASLLSSFQSITEKISKEQKQAAKNQGNLFGEDAITINTSADFMIDNTISDFTDREKLMFERELLGFFLTDHPMNQELNYLMGRVSHHIQELPEERQGRSILVGGLISQVKKIFTKKGNREMAFATIEDQFGFSLECVIFPKVYDEVRDKILKDSVVVMAGKLDFKDEIPVLLVEKVKKVGN
jgi:DNA polymerase-3 subunit alpha